MKHLLSIGDLSKKEIIDLILLTKKIKRQPQRYLNKLKNKNITLLFQKPSTRTRVSFEVGIDLLGGHPIILNWNESQLGRGETVEDTTRVLERYCDMIIARVHSHKDLIKMTRVAKIPIINSLSNLEHPCQIISDLFTIHEHFSTLKNIKISYIGDGNNVCNSLILGCASVGMNISVATPRGYEPDEGIIKKAKSFAQSEINVVNDPNIAVKNANVLYTDVWVSMGQEKEKRKRLKIFRSYQINKELLKKANKNAIVMHCLPAHRDLEITSEVMDGLQSVIFTQAENRMWIQMSILLQLLESN